MNHRRAETLWFWLFAGPAVVGFAAFSLWPMLESLWLSFCSYEVIAPPRFIGLQNYIYLFAHDLSFWPSVKVTLVFTVVQLPLAIGAALALALLLNQPVRATLFYGLNLYQQAFGYFHMGLASAMAWLLFAFILVVTFINFRVSRRWVHYGD